MLAASRANQSHFIAANRASSMRWKDRCAHRQVPLSEAMWKVKPYDAAITAGAMIAVGFAWMCPIWVMTGAQRGRSYPVCEVDGLVLVFPGNSALAASVH